jgi:hypothetical protein
MVFILLPFKIQTKKLLPKSLSLIIKILLLQIKQKWLLPFLLFYYCSSRSQIANYVNNGGFEICGNCTYTNQAPKPASWNAIDTTKFFGLLLSATISPYLVPNSSFTYQWPKGGNNYFLSTLFFKPNTPQTGRAYPRNTLKQTLHAGTGYCVKVYYSVTNQSSYGIDGLGVYFSDNSTDTISQCTKPITYLSPQVDNPNNNIFTDTLNWTLLTGTFTANGTEKYMMLGNFKSDVSTNSVLINPTNLPIIATEVIYDNISCIPLNLPAYASPGPDIWAIAGNTVYLGRPQDVGIDEACLWYKLPNTTNAIDTAAGITVTVAVTTETYMVRQDICGVIKYDTVVVHASGVGLAELKINNEELKISPNPAQDFLQVELILNEDNPAKEFLIYNAFGELVWEEELIFKNKQAVINTRELCNGVYFLKIQGNKSRAVSKRFIISK